MYELDIEYPFEIETDLQFLALHFFSVIDSIDSIASQIQRGELSLDKIVGLLNYYKELIQEL